MLLIEKHFPLVCLCLQGRDGSGGGGGTGAGSPGLPGDKGEKGQKVIPPFPYSKSFTIGSGLILQKKINDK